MSNSSDDDLVASRLGPDEGRCDICGCVTERSAPVCDRDECVGAWGIREMKLHPAPRMVTGGEDQGQATNGGTVMVSIKGLGKAKVLAALVNAASSLGMGCLQDNGKAMTEAEAEAWIDGGKTHDSFVGNSAKKRLYFDYVKGRPIKTDITGDEFDPWLYDRDNGFGAAERAVAALRASLSEMPSARGA